MSRISYNFVSRITEGDELRIRTQSAFKVEGRVVSVGPDYLILHEETATHERDVTIRLSSIEATAPREWTSKKP